MSTGTVAANEALQEPCVSPLAVVEGPYSVHFSLGCVVHPCAVIVAQRGPIYFGAYCVVEEHARIINSALEDEEALQVRSAAQPMTIGAYNHFKAFSHVVNVQRIGHGNQFEPHCRVEGANEEADGSTALCFVGDYCVVGAFVRLGRRQRGVDTVPDLEPQTNLTMAIPSRSVLLYRAAANGVCNCSPSLCCSCCCFWVLPRGISLDEEAADAAMRKKCCCLREVQLRGAAVCH
ncbi:hypothetical protein DQ04_00421080 [Trypanosoma grayi]|uniref:hypothetical protein n=1 Tax=Trypanosoma grayi TaxID=71804 RepID=UPI0004F43847|nr:hypothetical protein DQ04_00421080 [Trypanosoma grayi]KEG14529.1 hypothetical protein DQ04_00421080 [Trypanosoma grayi]